ncbi:MAG: ABC transporter ATP-binding protein [Myxococcota bacterium]|nr:ABC transporter ATP-binding protein [Myxococcota bacterium]
MRFFLRFAAAYPWRTALVILFMLLGVAVEGLGLSVLLTLLVVLLDEAGAQSADPSPLERAVREACAALGVSPTLGGLLVLFLAITVLKQGLQFLSAQQIGFTRARLVTDLRLLLIRSLAAARWGYFTRQPVGTLSASIAGEANRVAAAYLDFATMISLLAQALLYSALALTVSWEVTLAAGVAALIAVSAVRVFVSRIRRVARRRTEANRELLRNLSDGLQAVKPLKAMAREARLGPVVEKQAKRLKKVMRRHILLQESVKLVQYPLQATFVAAGVYAAFTWLRVPLAEIGTLVFLFNRTIHQVTRSQRSYLSMLANEHAVLAFEEQVELAASHREEVADGGAEPELRRGISLEGVSLRYGDHVVLEDVSVEIPAGRITAVVGPSGAGKTSLADLVVGLVGPERGAVRVDGVPLGDLDLRAWRRGIGYVPQEVFLINDTVRENVALGEPISDAEIEQALRRADAWDFVSALPEGTETAVEERGARLSGGQRQRICIARALVHEPRLLILDEATTALDPEAERNILDTVARLRGELTVLAISHQPALVSIADRVYRVEGGKVEAVERVVASPRSASR